MVNNEYNFANNLYKMGYGGPTTKVSYNRPISGTAPQEGVTNRNEDTLGT